MVQQLCSRPYEVSRKLSEQYVLQAQILPLLDGLDEMEEAARPACIHAIHDYYHEHMRPLVLCSRTDAYEKATVHEQLALSEVVIQPLSIEQVKTHLNNLGMTALQSALSKNAALQELATTPLFLQVLMHTYRGIAVQTLPQKKEQLQQQIWTDYVQRMTSDRGDEKRYPFDITYKWLGFLARQMQAHDPAAFFLEDLQPDWLSPRKHVYYRWSIALICGLGGGLLGLVYGLGGLIFGWQEEIQPVEILVWPWKRLLIWLLFGGLSGVVGDSLLGWQLGVVGGGLLGLAVGVGSGLSGIQLPKQLLSTPNEGIRRSIKYGLLIMLIGGLLGGLGNELLGRPLVGLGSGLIVGLGGGLISGLLFGLGAALRHYTLRIFLWQSGVFPLRAVPFLEDATARILLLRVGGGYKFIHGLLRGYFAEQNRDPATPSASVPPAAPPSSSSS